MGRGKNYVITSQKILSDDECKRLVLCCERQMRLYPDDKAPLMILIALECGLRATELLNVRVRDFDLNPGSIFIRSLKGSNPRELPLKYKRAAQLKAFVLRQNSTENWGSLDPDKRLFEITYQRFYQFWQFYRTNPNKGMHSLRHTFAVDFFRRTKDIKALQIALGHRNIDNTMVYLDFVYSQDVMRRLMHQTPRSEP